jgi:hypothetical protein
MSAVGRQERQPHFRPSDSSVKNWIPCIWKRILRSFSLRLPKVCILLLITPGSRKEETDESVREIALKALFNALEFIKSHFENEGSRAYLFTF